MCVIDGLSLSGFARNYSPMYAYNTCISEDQIRYEIIDVNFKWQRSRTGPFIPPHIGSADGNSIPGVTRSVCAWWSLVFSIRP